MASTGDIAHCLNAGGMGRQDYETETMVAHSLRGEGFDASEDGTGRGTPLVPVAFNWQGGATQTTLGFDPESGVTGCLQAHQTPAIAFSADWAVRRLTPRECERLQGFPDDFTAVPYRGKPAADGPRYKALGNSMAVPVVRWLGERIDVVDAMPAGRAWLASPSR